MMTPLRWLTTTCLVFPLMLNPAIADDALLPLVSGQALAPVEDTLALPQPMAQPMPETGETSGPDSVELAALYYYAEQKQEDRLQKETARLAAKYPGFMVPADLNQPAAMRGVDETALWTLYDKGDFDGIEAEIARMRTDKPQWQPSADFTSKLARKKQRVTMEAAAKAKDWAAIVEAGATLDPKTETDADLVWTLIDAYHETGMQDALAPLYRGLLFREGKDRLPDAALVTTIQKAIRDYPVADIQAVMNKVATTPAMKLALMPVAMDLVRKDIGEFNADLKRTEPIAEADIVRFKAMAEKSNDPADASLIGWYALKLADAAQAQTWFEKALAIKPDENNTKGLYLSLLTQKKDDAAFALATSHLAELQADPEFLMNALSIRFARPDAAGINAEIVKAYSGTILATLSAPHAEILGWYAYNSQQYEASEAWFSKALEWEPSPDRVKGLALSFQKLGKKAELAALKDKTLADYPAVWDEIRPAAIAAPKAVATAAAPATRTGYLKNFNTRNFSGCLADLQDLETRGRLSAEAQLVKGWCLMGLNRLAEARDAFAPALGANGKIRDDAAYGTALTLLRGKLTDDAEAVLSAYPLSAGRQDEIRAEIDWQRARSAFDHKQYQRVLDALNARLAIAPEPASMSQLRAWAHYNLGNRAEAKAIFERLNMHMSDAGVARGLNTLSTTPTQ